jgi:hypothetical protein
MQFSKVLVLFALLTIPAVSFCQFKNIVVEEVENEGKIAGKTYRIYAEMNNLDDQIFVVFGDSTHKLEVKSTKPFFQYKAGGALTKNIMRSELQKSDSLRYDSWVTIGAQDNYDNNINVLSVNFEDFEKKGGAITAKDGAWFCIPTDKQAYCKADKKILLMQLTTAGHVTGKINIMGKSKDGVPYTNYDVVFECGKKKK